MPAGVSSQAGERPEKKTYSLSLREHCPQKLGEPLFQLIE